MAGSAAERVLYLDVDTVVIHYFGRNKPWGENYHGVLDVFYHENQ